MTALYEVTKQALGFTMRDFASLRDFEAAKAVLQDSIRSALVEEEKAAAWLAERKEHWRKEKEKIQATDPELSAALGWPGGISDPVLDRKTLLQMVAALRLTSKQALEALEHATPTTDWSYMITALRAALAQEQTEPDISRCPQCNGPADNGFDRSFPPSPYLCTKCMAEPVEPVAWMVYTLDGKSVCVTDNPADFGEGHRALPLYTAPPRRTMVPLTEEEIFKIENDIPDDVISDRAWTICLTRAVEKAVWEKNHGQA